MKFITENHVPTFMNKVGQQNERFGTLSTQDSYYSLTAKFLFLSGTLHLLLLFSQSTISHPKLMTLLHFRSCLALSQNTHFFKSLGVKYFHFTSVQSTQFSFFDQCHVSFSGIAYLIWGMSASILNPTTFTSLVIVPSLRHHFLLIDPTLKHHHHLQPHPNLGVF